MFYRGVIILHVWAQGVVWQPGQWYRTEIVTGKIFSDNVVCVRYQSLLIHQLLMSYNISIKSGTNICFAVEEVKRLRGNPCYIYTRKESNMIQHGEGEEKISDGREVQREVRIILLQNISEFLFFQFRIHTINVYENTLEALHTNTGYSV